MSATLSESIRPNLVDKVIGYFNPRLASERTRARIVDFQIKEAFRNFDAANTGKRTAGWHAPPTSANAETKMGLSNLRNRSRDLIRNGPYAKKASHVVFSNVVATGIVPQIRANNEKARLEAENLWKLWAESTDCDYFGKLDFYGLQALAMQTVFESGECLIRLSRGTGNSKIPFQLQLLEGDFIDSSKEGILAQSKKNSITIQGVEFTAGRASGYWLFNQHPGEGLNIGTSFYSSRVDSAAVLHIYRLDRTGQVRGVPWLSNVMLRMQDLQAYEDGQLTRHTIASMFAMFLKDMDGANYSNSNLMKDFDEPVKPGTMIQLPAGKDLVFTSPPSADGYGEYVNNVLHSISSGLEVSYEAMTGDMSESSFSQARMAWLEFQRSVDFWRWNIIIPQMCIPIWNEFRQVLGILGYDDPSLKVTWTPPRRDMLDPKTEIEANIKAIRGGLTTLSEALRERGIDPVAHLTEMAEDNALLDKLGIILDSDPRRVMQSGTLQAPDVSEANEESARVTH